MIFTGQIITVPQTDTDCLYRQIKMDNDILYCENNIQPVYIHADDICSQIIIQHD